MLKFQRAPARASWPAASPNVCYLKDDNWDDFGFQTLFELGVVTADGVFHKIGPVKVTRRGLQSGRVMVPESFDALDDDFCSLGQDQNYYEQLYALPEGLGPKILDALRDCVAEPSIWSQFQHEIAVQTSLLRSVSSASVETTFRDIVQGRVPSTPYEFVFRVPLPNDVQPLTIDVRVVPHATPPTNVHVLIGRNGVGKSRMLAGIAAALTGAASPPAFGMAGSIEFTGATEEAGRFANVVTVAFSAFDRFAPLGSAAIQGDIRYSYVGLKQEAEDESRRGSKTPDELVDEFRTALQACLEGPRRDRLRRTLRILGSDPGFAELEFAEDASSVPDDEVFQRLSSGHKIVLLTATRLVELVDERTLVLLDEPECHLHPPLLSSFVRALADLLVQRNGVAVVATHSPVVLQEVPRSCVSILRRSGEMVTAERPVMETFGENVGILTHEVFRLEATESGFYRMLADAAAEMSYDEVFRKFDGQIGAEGRAVARALTSAKQG